MKLYYAGYPADKSNSNQPNWLLVGYGKSLKEAKRKLEVEVMVSGFRNLYRAPYTEGCIEKEEDGK